MRLRLLPNFLRRRVFLAVLAVCILTAVNASLAGAQAPPAKAEEKPFVVEYYYKARWGFQNEFLRLFQKNHWPVLKKEMEMGRILQLSIVKPRYHATEDGRWDFRVTIVWKSAAVAHDNFNPQPLLEQLFPDQETFRREEQRRFEILQAHWDLPIQDVKPD